MSYTVIHNSIPNSKSHSLNLCNLCVHSFWCMSAKPGSRSSIHLNSYWWLFYLSVFWLSGSISSFLKYLGVGTQCHSILLPSQQTAHLSTLIWASECGRTVLTGKSTWWKRSCLSFHPCFRSVYILWNLRKGGMKSSGSVEGMLLTSVLIIN